MNTQRVEGHTPLPWRAEKEDTDSGLNCDWLVQALCGGCWDNIAACGGAAYEDHWEYTDELRKANAEFIVHACNNIERLEKVNEALVMALELLYLDVLQGADPASKECQERTGSFAKAAEAIRLAKEPA